MEEDGDTKRIKPENLPSKLMVSKITAARGKEIQILRKAISTSTTTKMAFQKLPKHMRRRTMSHNVKRLPRKLRDIHRSQMKKSGLPPKQKRPSRKYRRRPYNLMSDYERRQKSYHWLNTHIWHAKRFHMIEKWGYKLPDRPCDRSFRACYRATKMHCLLQDISYFQCVQITGDYERILDHFKLITDKNLGLTVGAKCYSKGNREGKVLLLKPTEDPILSHKAIGTIYFNWKPEEINKKRSIWLWIHSAFYKEALTTLINCFNVKSANMDTDQLNDVSLYVNDQKSLELKELRKELNRFRLTGPLSNAVLQNGFKLARNNVEGVININEEQRNFWDNLKNITSTTELPPHLITSIVIVDPRYHFPSKRTKAEPGFQGEKIVVRDIPENVSCSPLWDEDLRVTVAQSKISNAELADIRKNLLVPGSEMEEAVSLPVMLIQRPGMPSSGQTSGWDLIIPAVWSQSIWLCLIMWGARAGGLRETESITFETGQLEFLQPDTDAGEIEENNISNKYKETYFKKPPNKRVNYNKLNVASPFNWNWKLLIQNWKKDKDGCVQDFFVLRDKKVLRNIQESFTPKKFKSSYDLPDFDQNCIVPVRLVLKQKGLCKRFAMICLPTIGDMRKEPEEEKVGDKCQKERKEMRDHHKTLLKRLRKRRIRARNSGKRIPIDKEMLTEYTSRMRQLWLPSATNIRNSCSREVIGFVKHGDFSFSVGHSTAVGYVAIGALPYLLNNTKCKSNVLVRNTDSRQYRMATLEIIL